jgi:hypothetical protein
MLDTGCKMLNAGYWILDKTRFSDPETRKRIWDRMNPQTKFSVCDSLRVLASPELKGEGGSAARCDKMILTFLWILSENIAILN